MDKEKHLSYYSLLETMREVPGCVLCELESQHLQHYLSNLLHENVNDPGLRQKLAASGGFCHRHAHILASCHDALGVAILYQEQVSGFCRFLEKSAKKSVKSFNHKTREKYSCPACLAEQNYRLSKIKTFLEWLGDDELRAAFEGGPGFCREHLLAVLTEVGNQDVYSYIVDLHLKKFSTLLGELKEFIRKNDYRFVQEGFGKEKDSWLRAVKMLVGGKDLF